MKQLWLGIGLLAAILLLSLWTQHTMGDIHLTAAHQLEQAADAALEGDWSRALPLAKSAQSRWEARRHLTASLADQTPMDQVEMLFAELQIHIREQESAHFAAICAQLSRLIKATGDAHCFSWQSLL